MYIAYPSVSPIRVSKFYNLVRAAAGQKNCFQENLTLATRVGDDIISSMGVRGHSNDKMPKGKLECGIELVNWGAY